MLYVARLHPLLIWFSLGVHPDSCMHKTAFNKCEDEIHSKVTDNGAICPCKGREHELCI